MTPTCTALHVAQDPCHSASSPWPAVPQCPPGGHNWPVPFVLAAGYLYFLQYTKAILIIYCLSSKLHLAKTET